MERRTGGEGKEEQMAKLVKEAVDSLRSLKESVNNLPKTLKEIMQDSISILNKRIDDLSFNAPPSFLILDAKNGEVVSPMDLRVNKRYTFCLRKRGFEKEVFMKVVGERLQKFFGDYKIDMTESREANLSRFWTCTVEIKDGFGNGWRARLSRKVEGTLQIFVNNVLDLTVRIRVRKPLSQWICGILAILASAAVAMVAKLLEILSSVFSFTTFLSGAVVGAILAVLLAYHLLRG